MTVDSRNIVGAGLALAIIGLAAWGSSVLLTPAHEVQGTVEIRPLSFTVDDAKTTATPSTDSTH